MIHGSRYNILCITLLILISIQLVSAIYTNSSANSNTTDYNKLVHAILDAVRNYMFVNTSRYEVDYIEPWCEDCTFYGAHGIIYKARLVRDDKISFVVRFYYLATLGEIVEIYLTSPPPINDVESIVVDIDQGNETAFINLDDAIQHIVKILDLIKKKSFSSDYYKLYTLFTGNTSLLKNADQILLHQLNNSLHNIVSISRDYLLSIDVNKNFENTSIINTINIEIYKKLYLNTRDYARHRILKISLAPLHSRGNTSNNIYFIEEFVYIPFKITIKPGKYPFVSSFNEEAASYAEKIIRKEGYDPAKCRYELLREIPIVHKRRLINETTLEVEIEYGYLYRTYCGYGLLIVAIDPLTGNISGEFLKTLLSYT